MGWDSWVGIFSACVPPHCLYFEARGLSLSVRAHAYPSLWPAQKPAVCDLRIAPLLSAHVPVPPAQGTQTGLVPFLLHAPGFLDNLL